MTSFGLDWIKSGNTLFNQSRKHWKCKNNATSCHCENLTRKETTKPTLTRLLSKDGKTYVITEFKDTIKCAS